MGKEPLAYRAQMTAERALTAVLRALRLREPVIRARKARTRARRRRAERRGSDRLSRPALHGMDGKLDEVLDRRGGFFVEAGAYDGFTQSNTYWLEQFRGWRGILIEPMPALYEECRRERPQATIVHAALVPAGFPEETIRMQFGELMSSVRGAHGDQADDLEWARPGLVLGWRDAYEAEVPARTLSSILDEHGAPEVDLLSLDVEGFEPQALGGLDFDRHAPRWIVVEAHDLEDDRAAIEAVLGDLYELASQISPLDLLYRRRDVGSARR
jgi:FkbM family methyltransferase